MERLEEAGAALAEKAATSTRERIAARVDVEVPGVAVRVDMDGIVLTGRGLRARLLSEPVLRWIGSLVR
ncbi:MAG TPA: hypothetical protein VM657_08410 [Sphingomonas sp.]|nr:hypothetical protein [Sphingomonas sp.]